MSRGVTMLEVIVALVLLGLLLGVSTAAIRSFDAPAASRTLRELAAIRDSAIAAGASRVWVHQGVAVRFDPDGSSSGGSVAIDGKTYVIDPVTGAIREGH